MIKMGVLFSWAFGMRLKKNSERVSMGCDAAIGSSKDLMAFSRLEVLAFAIRSAPAREDV